MHRCKHKRTHTKFNKHDGKGKDPSFTMWVQAAQDRIRVEPLKLQSLKEKKHRKKQIKERELRRELLNPLICFSFELLLIRSQLTNILRKS